MGQQSGWGRLCYWQRVLKGKKYKKSNDEPEVYDEPVDDKTTEHTTMQEIADQEVEEEENMKKCTIDQDANTYME